jgi:hypothetical protein
MGNAYTILIEKSEGKISLGIRRRRWEKHIKMDVKEIGYEGVGLDSSGTG